MAQTQLNGFGMAHGVSFPLFQMSTGPGFTSATIAATGDKITVSGRFWHPARVAKDVSRICFRWGSITKAGGSAMTLSLQDVDQTAGPPIRPDETQDQTVAVANGDASFVSNTWYRSGALSANRTLTPGDYVSFVCEYDGGGRLGADTVSISQMTIASANVTGLMAQPVTKIGGSWAVVASTIPNLVLECSDGSFGTIAGSICGVTANTHAFNSGSGADELALAFTVPMACKVDGAWFLATPSTSAANFSVILYDGTSAMTGGTIAFDANATVPTAGVARFFFIPFTQEITLVASTQYYLSFRPDTATNVSVYSFDVNDANHLKIWPGGTAMSHATRVDAGSWTPTTTRRMFAGINISSVDDGTGSGGGTVIAGTTMLRGMVNV